MHPTRRPILGTILAATAASVLGGRPARAASRVPGRLVMGLSAWPASLSPWQNAGTVAQNAKLLMFRGLLGYGPDGTLQGELAERWEQENETTWRFTLREALFHDGR